MITCPFCKSTHIDNTLFCDECGTYLIEEDTRDTFQLEDDYARYEQQLPKAPYPDTGVLKTSAKTLKPPTIRLKIGARKREVEAVLDKTVHLGRLDPNANVYPDIDLTEENGLESGISRKHLRLLFRRGKVMVEDLGSINGTTLNGKKLSSYLPEELIDGDIMQLGKLTVEITILS